MLRPAAVRARQSSKGGLYAALGFSVSGWHRSVLEEVAADAFFLHFYFRTKKQRVLMAMLQDEAEVTLLWTALMVDLTYVSYVR